MKYILIICIALAAGVLYSKEITHIVNHPEKAVKAGKAAASEAVKAGKAAAKTVTEQ